MICALSHHSLFSLMMQWVVSFQGVTYWNTWVSCEENGDSGYCYEVDPYTGYTSLTNVVPQGGGYESFAYDNNDPTATRFFVTEDRSKGALV